MVQARRPVRLQSCLLWVSKAGGKRWVGRGKEQLSLMPCGITGTEVRREICSARKLSFVNFLISLAPGVLHLLLKLQRIHRASSLFVMSPNSSTMNSHEFIFTSFLLLFLRFCRPLPAMVPWLRLPQAEDSYPGRLVWSHSTCPPDTSLCFFKWVSRTVSYWVNLAGCRFR